MERSRTRTLLGLVLVVVGIIWLSRAFMHSALPAPPPLPALPSLPALPTLPPLLPVPPLPALPPLPPVPPLAPIASVLHFGAWPLIILVVLGVAIWQRRCGGRKAPLG